MDVQEPRDQGDQACLHSDCSQNDESREYCICERWVFVYPLLQFGIFHRYLRKGETEVSPSGYALLSSTSRFST